MWAHNFREVWEMDIDTVGDLWASYIARGVTRIVNEENDTMYKGGKDWYWSVGESGARPSRRRQLDPVDAAGLTSPSVTNR
jgi:hypothetical protein